MTKLEALDILKEEKQLRTDILEPLDISFEFFLHFSQLDEKRQRRHVKRLIKREEKKVQQSMNEIVKKIRNKYAPKR
tara:strand:- start:380 stop:610 length:231 start_codon:yes stop_codon:yes gene_type:complete